MGFLDFLSGKKERVIDIDNLNPNQLSKVLESENIDQKAEMDKLKIKLNKYEKSKDAEEREEEVRLFLDKQRNELRESRKTSYFSFRDFFSKVLHSKNFKKKGLYFTDYERKNFAKFHDIGIDINTGELVAIRDGGEVILKHPEVKQFFSWLKSLEEDLKLRKIPLCLDQDGYWQENPLALDVPEVDKMADGRLRFRKTPKKPFYEKIADKNEEIDILRREVFEKEEELVVKDNEISDLRQAIITYEKRSEGLQANMSEVTNSSTNVANAFNKIASSLDMERFKSAINEDNIEKLSNQVDKLRIEAEREGSKLSDARTRETLTNMAQLLRNLEPSVKIIENKPQEGGIKPQNS